MLRNFDLIDFKRFVNTAKKFGIKSIGLDQKEYHKLLYYISESSKRYNPDCKDIYSLKYFRMYGVLIINEGQTKEYWYLDTGLKGDREA